jgi:hypothetical protein
MPGWLQTAGAWSWRLLLVAVAVYVLAPAAGSSPRSSAGSC